ncbi:hydroxymethylbilane synthase [Labilibaculum sp. DW002]|uniref:Porphobilinogen deaminase n=1 Tax=Paralabilibaculum antarcticum TaxID=2912572 RepID=A0ABT5VMU7_9BACT|nr:hydroxymethylbilane synthase [Labilibaculum sp. DW002]MDE5416581.1 hydroxymethylbilane synthase [Labilibaculum sp. DW002]
MTSKKKIVVATRPSLLAYTQTMQTVELLQKANPDIEFEVKKFSTQGDRVLNRSLTEFGTTGLFVKELEHALLEGEADIAVHSLKDVPSFHPAGLKLVAYPEREDVRDIFLTKDGKTLEEMPAGFILGTGSPRRRVQLANVRDDIEFKEIRGNIDTRIQKLHDGEYDAIILAAAGLNRLGKEFNESAFIDVDQCIPAIGQGAIAIECRSDDAETISILEKVNHKATELAVLAERAFMAEIEGGCKFPLAAHAVVDGKHLNMIAIVGDLKTNQYITEGIEVSVDESVAKSKELASKMKEICKEKGINFYL